MRNADCRMKFAAFHSAFRILHSAFRPPSAFRILLFLRRIPRMPDVQTLCEIGSEELLEMRYLESILTFEQAEKIALNNKDWDTIARLYMPLQEARRQVRQRCGEGIVQLDLLATSPSDQPDGVAIIQRLPHGQLLVAGWASIAPAIQLRRLAREKKLYVETYLAAVYPVGEGRVVAIVPTADVKLPNDSPRSIDKLINLLPLHSIVLPISELPKGPRLGTPETYAETMAIWERLAAPFLAAADMQVDPVQKIHGYRATIAVDYACELAHQKLSDVARELGRKR